MDFFIRKGATLPMLKLQLIRDGRLDYNKFAEILESSSISFSMVNRDTGIYKIANKAATVVAKTVVGQENPEYYLAYKFTAKDTRDPGTYYGEFKIIYDEYCDDSLESGVLKMPIREELYIHILDSFTNSETINR